MFITGEIRESTISGKMSMRNDLKKKENSHNRNEFELTLTKVTVKLCENLGSLCDQLFTAEAEIQSEFKRFLEEKFVV